jgi:trimeric autotransporter adhesin
MSTKTLRKRIALVAVAGLGFGLLSATTASATDLAAADLEISNTAGNGLLTGVGVCSVATTATTAGTTVVSTGTVVAAGAVLSVLAVASDGLTGTMVLTGPAVWYTVPGGTVDATAKTLSVLTTAGANVLKTTGVGAVTLSLKGVAGNTIRTIGISVVAACAAATTPVAANTDINLVIDPLTAASGTDEILLYASTDYDSTLYVAIVVRNGYEGDVDAGLLTATATNGALIAFDGPGVVSTAFTGPTQANTAAAQTLYVDQDTTTNPGKALTTTITFSFNGVTVGTKTVTITGVAASVTVSNVVGGITDNAAGTFDFVTKDNAGNNVESAAAATINWTTAGLEAGDIVTEVIGTTDYLSTFTTKGTGYFDCATTSTKSSGSVDVAIGFLDSALNLVKSNTFKAVCGGFADTFTVALDKAIYSTGEIATLTITAKDANGFAVGDNTATDVGTTADLGGMTIIGSLPASTDAYSGGVKTYKFRVNQDLGSFVGQALVLATTDTSVKTVQYKIISSDVGGIQLADVLKAIVSLIASINKQIAALQKALLKK